MKSDKPVKLHRRCSSTLIVACLLLFIQTACSNSNNNGAEPDNLPIKADFPFESKYIQVLGSRMHYVDEGAGEVILLLHGNPESVYSWRNVIRELTVAEMDALRIPVKLASDSGTKWPPYQLNARVTIIAFGVATLAMFAQRAVDA